jgi:hypothetical protein
MTRWHARVDDLLFDGEDVETEVEVDEGAVVVTSHRVLAFTPDTAGANFDYVDRPNVSGVEQTTRGSVGFLATAVKAFVVGAILVAAGQVVSLDEMVGGIDVGTGGEMGLGGFIGLMQSLLNLLALLDELLVAAGAIALLVGALFLGAYAWSREELLVVEVAGDDDIELPVPERDDAVADDLDRAVGPGPATGADDLAESGVDPLQ